MGFKIASTFFASEADRTPSNEQGAGHLVVSSIAVRVLHDRVVVPVAGGVLHEGVELPVVVGVPHDLGGRQAVPEVD